MPTALLEAAHRSPEQKYDLRLYDEISYRLHEQSEHINSKRIEQDGNHHRITTPSDYPLAEQAQYHGNGEVDKQFLASILRSPDGQLFGVIKFVADGGTETPGYILTRFGGNHATAKLIGYVEPGEHVSIRPDENVLEQGPHSTWKVTLDVNGRDQLKAEYDGSEPLEAFTARTTAPLESADALPGELWAAPPNQVMAIAAIGTSAVRDAINV